MTDGQVELGRRSFPKERKRTTADILGLSNIQDLLNGAQAEKEPWIAARNPKAADAEWVKLAKWERPQEGFPCLLVDKREVRCHDRESLEEAIAELLSNAWIGEQLRELLARPLNQGDVESDSKSDSR